MVETPTYTVNLNLFKQQNLGRSEEIIWDSFFFFSKQLY